MLENTGWYFFKESQREKRQDYLKNAHKSKLLGELEVYILSETTSCISRYVYESLFILNPRKIWRFFLLDKSGTFWGKFFKKF